MTVPHVHPKHCAPAGAIVPSVARIVIILVAALIGVLPGNSQSAKPSASNATLAAQQQPVGKSLAPAALSAFDVASIHPHQPLPHERSHILNSNGRFATLNVSLKAIIQWAFDIPEGRIIGGPSWLGSSRWDIEAKAENAIDMQKAYSPAEAKLEKRRMVQSLLVERFMLATHTETRELPIYALVVAKGGPKFLSSQASGTMVDHGNGNIRIQGGDDTVALLAEELAEALGRVVVDKTGMEGRYKLVLTWTPDDRVTTSSSSSAFDSGPSIFTALQEQLGLKLEPQKGPVEVLVIDRAEVPSAN
ncbi:MAG: TIGR03435 family protein [Terracidiphilus sp.]